MGLPKGRTNNPNGKPKGSRSVKTLAWEALGDKITNEHTERVNEYLDSLWETDKEAYFKAYALLIEYFKPKQQRTEHAGDEKMPVQVIFKKGDSKGD